MRELKCTNGLLKVYEDRIVISRNTIMGFASQGLKGDKTLFFSDLISVEYKRPSVFANGYIRFLTAATEEKGKKIGKFGCTTQESLKDPNTLILRAFNKQIPKESEELYNYILQKISECKKSNMGSNSVSSADEILKFKELLDQGIITEEEFERKKQELLK